MKPAFITALGERISRPSVVNTQESPNENTHHQRQRGQHAGHAGAGPEAEDQPSTMITVPAST